MFLIFLNETNYMFFYYLCCKKGKSMKIYVGNLSYNSTEETIRNQFSQFGEVTSVEIVMDKISGKSKGFGFVEMPDENNARSAISTLNQKDIDGRKVRVSEAQERKPRENS